MFFYKYAAAFFATVMLITTFAVAAPNKNSKDWRNYLIPMTDKEKKDLKYIIMTLGHKSLVKIGLLSSTLKKAGDRIDNLHPLRFLMGIFTDEEMTAAMFNIKDRKFCWEGFMDGVRRGMTEETARNNVLIEQIQDFSQIVKVDFNLIYPPIQQSKWDELVLILIANVPRNGKQDRYDM